MAIAIWLLSYSRLSLVTLILHCPPVTEQVCTARNGFYTGTPLKVSLQWYWCGCGWWQPSTYFSAYNIHICQARAPLHKALSLCLYAHLNQCKRHCLRFILLHCDQRGSAINRHGCGWSCSLLCLRLAYQRTFLQMQIKSVIHRHWIYVAII